MIVYQLACGQGHFFEGWFASADACEKQTCAGQLRCPACDSRAIRKLPSAPHVHTSGGAACASPTVDAANVHTAVLLKLRKFILENTEDVGRMFPEMARRIHYQEDPARNIRGEVTLEEAAALQEEGVEAYAISPEVLASGKAH